MTDDAAREMTREELITQNNGLRARISELEASLKSYEDDGEEMSPEMMKEFGIEIVNSVTLDSKDIRFMQRKDLYATKRP